MIYNMVLLFYRQLLGSSLMQTLQSNLSALVQSCLLEGDRSIAHKCAKLIALCLE